MQSNIGGGINFSQLGFAQSNNSGENLVQNCCPDALTLARGFTISSGAGVLSLWYVLDKTFSSAHIPEYAGTRYFYRTFGSRTFSLSDVKSEAKSFPIRERMGQPGSYTITFEGGYKYHGKGPINRMFDSAVYRIGQHQRLATSFEWTPSISERESHKDEYKRMQRDKVLPQYPEGYMNPINYNVIQSWGYLYMKQDGY
ncbi:hypothetical protein LNP04_06200 [Chryseobacterium sp. C-71]|uniref:hypothetical protein n=1 Tax=Chryseobacterium sp. C-71 TaxID=2893882 RepID=UPI001E588032|nr:hypothetical protein [Chryseobacterium sp. C-71]UFH33307.1 hypothetical protein LNP04_06200 [Chryseobacterium sp. C-71]